MIPVFVRGNDFRVSASLVKVAARPGNVDDRVPISRVRDEKSQQPAGSLCLGE